MEKWLNLLWRAHGNVGVRWVSENPYTEDEKNLKNTELKINRPDSYTNENWKAWRNTRALTDSSCENASYKGQVREADKLLTSAGFIH